MGISDCRLEIVDFRLSQIATEQICNLKSQILNLKSTLPGRETANTVFLFLKYAICLIYIAPYISNLREINPCSLSSTLMKRSTGED